MIHCRVLWRTRFLRRLDKCANQFTVAGCSIAVQRRELLGSLLAVSGNEIAPRGVLRRAPNFVHQPVVHQPSEAGAGGPRTKPDDGCDLAGQSALPV